MWENTNAKKKKKKSYSALKKLILLTLFFIFGLHLFSFFQIPSYGANALPSQDPPKLHLQDQPIQTSQVSNQ